MDSFTIVMTSYKEAPRAVTEPVSVTVHRQFLEHDLQIGPRLCPGTIERESDAILTLKILSKMIVYRVECMFKVGANAWDVPAST